MVHIAIAGGTGGLGRTFVDAFVNAGNHEVFVMTRNPTTVFAHQPSVRILTTTYDSVPDLIHLLTTHSIHTIICTFNPPTPTVYANQLHLMRAAAATPTVVRFIPSEFAIDYSLPDSIFPLTWKPLKQAALAELRGLSATSGLEYIVIHNGWFLDYFGMPHEPSHMIPEIAFVDIGARAAAIPGSADIRVTWTHTADLARFVERLCCEADGAWPRRAVVHGDTASFSEILQAARSARGDSNADADSKQWRVTVDALETLRRGMCTELPSYAVLFEMFGEKEAVLQTYAAFGHAMALGKVDFSGVRRAGGKVGSMDGESHDGLEEYVLLNERYPDIKTRKVADFIEEAWHGR